jgi:hypothetical protein
LPKKQFRAAKRHSLLKVGKAFLRLSGCSQFNKNVLRTILLNRLRIFCKGFYDPFYFLWKNFFSFLKSAQRKEVKERRLIVFG